MMVHVLRMFFLCCAVSISAVGDPICSLNGKLERQTCQCDIPWAGDHCENLITMPINAASSGAAIYGYAPNVSTWGGSIHHSKNQDCANEYHLFVAQMKQGGLIGWGTQSMCVHAVSERPDGPFTARCLNPKHNPNPNPDADPEYISGMLSSRMNATVL